MNCKTVIANIDNYLDGYLDNSAQESFRNHLEQCPACRMQIVRAQNLLGSLKTLPVPQMSPEFQTRVWSQVKQKSYSQKARYSAWVAVAAVFILFIGIGVDYQNSWFVNQSQKNVVEIEIDNTRDIRLVFNSKESLKNVTFSLELPDGVELAGFGNKREIMWQGELEKGKNLLVLPIIARSPKGGVLIAHVNHTNESRQFKLHLNVRKLGKPDKDTRRLNLESNDVFMSS